MMKHNQDGAAVTLVLLIISIALLVVVSIVAVMETSSASNTKNTVNQQIAAAVSKAQTAQQTIDTANFQKQSESPYLSYNGPATFGSLSFNYPRNWSAYVLGVSDSSQTTLLDGYFYPGILPSVDDTTATNFAFRVNISSTDYATSLSGLTTDPTTVNTVPYSLPNVPSVIGTKITGQLGNNKTGTMIVLPLRGQTLELFTEGGSYNSEFNQILSSVKFNP